jgi:hypothetical protein
MATAMRVVVNKEGEGARQWRWQQGWWASGLQQQQREQ